jgi:hypothetical protein
MGGEGSGLLYAWLHVVSGSVCLKEQQHRNCIVVVLLTFRVGSCIVEKALNSLRRPGSYWDIAIMGKLVKLVKVLSRIKKMVTQVTLTRKEQQIWRRHRSNKEQCPYSLCYLAFRILA